nr:hypothetical protein [uncultured Desulfobacter sp.]
MNNFKLRYAIAYISTLIIVAAAFCACAGKQIKKEIVFEIDSHPPGALCTLHYQEKEQFGSPITVIGETPLKKEVSFYTATDVWLKIEKRGVQPFVAKIDTARPVKISATLTPADETVCPPNTTQLLNESDDILVLMPRIKVIARGTLGNETSQQENNRISGIIGRGVTAELQKTKPARLLDKKSSAGKRCNALWRDGRTAMEIVDPVRFSYATCPVRLETASGRKKALKIGREYNAKAVMLISGKVDYEQGSLVASKIGLNVLGTAASFAGGYGNAMSNNQSYFTYTVYTPQFTDGTCISALLVDTNTGEILWMNKGLWHINDFSKSEDVKKMIRQLLTNLKGE